MNIPVLMLTPNKIRDPHIGQTEINVGKFFRAVSCLTPCIIIIDEADNLLGTPRTSQLSSSGQHDAKLANLFQMMLEGGGVDSADYSTLGVTWALVTNYFGRLEDAMQQRVKKYNMEEYEETAEQYLEGLVTLCRNAGDSITYEEAVQTQCFVTVVSMLVTRRERNWRDIERAANTVVRMDRRARGIGAMDMETQVTEVDAGLDKLSETAELMELLQQRQQQRQAIASASVDAVTTQSAPLIVATEPSVFVDPVRGPALVQSLLEQIVVNFDQTKKARFLAQGAREDEEMASAANEEQSARSRSGSGGGGGGGFEEDVDMTGGGGDSSQEEHRQKQTAAGSEGGSMGQISMQQQKDLATQASELPAVVFKTPMTAAEARAHQLATEKQTKEFLALADKLLGVAPTAALRAFGEAREQLDQRLSTLHYSDTAEQILRRTSDRWEELEVPEDEMTARRADALRQLMALEEKDNDQIAKSLQQYLKAQIDIHNDTVASFKKQNRSDSVAMLAQPPASIDDLRIGRDNVSVLYALASELRRPELDHVQQLILLRRMKFLIERFHLTDSFRTPDGMDVLSLLVSLDTTWYGTKHALVAQERHENLLLFLELLLRNDVRPSEPPLTEQMVQPLELAYSKLGNDQALAAFTTRGAGWPTIAVTEPAFYAEWNNTQERVLSTLIHAAPMQVILFQSLDDVTTLLGVMKDQYAQAHDGQQLNDLPLPGVRVEFSSDEEEDQDGSNDEQEEEESEDDQREEEESKSDAEEAQEIDELAEEKAVSASDEAALALLGRDESAQRGFLLADTMATDVVAEAAQPTYPLHDVIRLAVDMSPAVENMFDYVLKQAEQSRADGVARCFAIAGFCDTAPPTLQAMFRHAALSGRMDVVDAIILLLRQVPAQLRVTSVSTRDRPAHSCCGAAAECRCSTRD